MGTLRTLGRRSWLVVKWTGIGLFWLVTGVGFLAVVTFGAGPWW